MIPRFLLGLVMLAAIWLLTAIPVWADPWPPP
jgi:hypothetical protein